MESTADLRRARIFLVDDTQANLDLLQALFEPEGYLVSVAPGGEFALKFVTVGRGVGSGSIPTLLVPRDPSARARRFV